MAPTNMAPTNNDKMVLIDDARLSRFLLELYRGAHEQPAERFQAWGFDRLRNIIDFDLGEWGSGVMATRILHSVYDYRRPGLKPQVGAPIEDQERTVPECIAGAGHTVNLSDADCGGEAEVSQQVQRPFYSRFGSECGLATFIRTPVSGLFDFLSLYRVDTRRPFSEGERRFKEMVTPHLFSAHQYNLFHHAWQVVCDNPRRYAAICDRRGVVRHMEASFATLLHKEWSAWRGPRLPFDVNPAPRRGRVRSYVGHRIVIQISPLNDLLFLHGREKTAIDTLSPRQAQVARDLAGGRTYKEVAEKRRISTSTVTKHVNAIYAKLGISNRTQLANLL